MKLQALLIYLVLSTFNISLTSCIENPFAESKLPKEMPKSTSFRYSDSGGMTPYWYRVEVRDNVISVEDKNYPKKEQVNWFAEISEEDKRAVYKVFVENKFDLIENEEPEGVTYDAGSEGVYIRAGEVSKNVSSGANSPLSRKNTKRWNAAAASIKNLAKKYEAAAKPTLDNFAVFGHKAKLTPIEIEKIRTLIEKAVSNYNLTQSSDSQIADLSVYKHQLTPEVSSDGEKLVSVNSFCTKEKDWKRKLVVVDDGGNCFFNLNINLSKETILRFEVNGEG